ncbi:MAG: DNA polymerase III subunit delta' [Pseudomonadota bacterium]|nr:DNA polymerase III subunit delta' [Pseudomonadota bacterium]
MADGPDRPAPDEISEALHPAMTPFLAGHAEAEAALAAAANAGSIHHAWLFTGPPGIGKATLAYRFTRSLLAGPSGGGLFGAPPAGLHGDPDDPLFAQVAQASHPNLLVLRRSWNFDTKRYASEIRVDDVRRLAGFLGQRASRRGRRVVLVDAADDLNRNAANALLKPLEEPPADTVFILVAHAPGGLLPTIRSRCRRLVLRPLSAGDADSVVARQAPELDPSERAELLALSDNAPGRALRLAAAGGTTLYRRLLETLSGLPAIDPGKAQALGDMVADRSSGETAFALLTDMLDGLLKRLVRAGQGDTDTPPAEAELLARLGGVRLDQWFEVWDNLARLRERTEAVNLNRKAVLLSLLSAFETAAARTPGTARR